ncbi:MAG: transcription antitermination factor NusB [Desulfobacterales bacterium]|nr:transcription antitermination factor NusB [Desulfobacterales bacterium]
MGKRRKSREFALQALYQRNITREDALRILGQLRAHLLSEGEGDEFGDQIVIGVLEHCSQIDQLIEQYSEHWRLDRMSMIDRTILRIATFELLYRDDIPAKVTLNEAIDLGKRFGSTDSGSFINGILDRIQREIAPKADASH